MNRNSHVAVLFTWLLAAAPAGAAPAASSAAPAPSAPAAKPIADLAWLVDGVWVADASRLGPGMQRIETRYRWSDNGSFIRFTTHFVTDKTALKTYDGNFFWDPDRRGLAMWYMSAENEVTQGAVTRRGEDLVMDFHGPDMSGVPADLRVTVTRVSPDLYHWTLTEKTGDTWKPLLALDYARRSDG